MLEHRINSCQLFAEKKCPNQLTMERAYLIPQFLDPKQLQQYQDLARSCKCATISSKECKDNWDSRVPPEYDSDCTCEGCERTLGQRKSPIEFWFYTEPHYFCDQMCRDKWLLGISDNL
jgi:hypothetical protein